EEHEEVVAEGVDGFEREEEAAVVPREVDAELALQAAVHAAAVEVEVRTAAEASVEGPIVGLGARRREQGREADERGEEDRELVSHAGDCTSQSAGSCAGKPGPREGVNRAPPDRGARAARAHGGAARRRETRSRPSRPRGRLRSSAG